MQKLAEALSSKTDKTSLFVHRLSLTPLDVVPRAAVLVPLFTHNSLPKDVRGEHSLHVDGEELWVVLTIRSSQLSSHPGEVCFPGGRREPSDHSDVECALREAKEEINLSRDLVKVLGCLPPTLSKHQLLVVPVVSLITNIDAFFPVYQRSEVERAFAVPLRAFLLSKYHSTFDGMWKVPWGPPQGHRYRVHTFHFPDEWPLEESFAQCSTNSVSNATKNSQSAAVPDARTVPNDGNVCASGGRYTFTENTSSNLDSKRTSAIRLSRTPMIWGLTAQILVQVATSAYGVDPQFEFLPGDGPSYSQLAELFFNDKLDKKSKICPHVCRQVTQTAECHTANMQSKLVIVQHTFILHVHTAVRVSLQPYAASMVAR